MGENNVFRARIFGEALKSICAHYRSSPSVLPPQLGITRSALLNWTLVVYKQEIESVLKGFRSVAATGGHDVKSSRAFANNVHHYAYAILGGSMQQQQQQQSSAVAVDIAGTGTTARKWSLASLSLDDDPNIANYQLRKMVFDLLKLNIKKRRALNEAHKKANGGKMLTEWPEHLKAVAEAGQNIVQLNNVHVTTQERRTVVQEVNQLLDEMLTTCHSQQRPAVLLMRAHMHAQLGLLEINDAKDFAAALKEFEAGLRISESVAAIYGDHILVSPLAQVANILAASRQYARAEEMFTRAITLSAAHVGEDHASMAQLNVNYGIMLVESGRFGTAAEILRKADRILTKAHAGGALILGYDVLRSRIKEFLIKATK
jgi:tetratricopeptide (TPR) repeat protein